VTKPLSRFSNSVLLVSRRAFNTSAQAAQKSSTDLAETWTASLETKSASCLSICNPAGPSRSVIHKSTIESPQFTANHSLM
jgi:hypothetical protein